jgi:phage baseplate assembly protein W
MSRSERYTFYKNTPSYYADFLMNLDRNPMSGSVALAANEEAIKNSIKNLILTNRGERFYDLNIGSKIRSMLFEPFTLDTVSNMESVIREAISNYEPRCVVEQIVVDDDIDRNGINISIFFSMINIPRVINFTLFISRVR